MKNKPFIPNTGHVDAEDNKTFIFVARRLVTVLEQSIKIAEAGESVPDYLRTSAKTWVAVAWTMYRESSKTQW